MEASRHSFILGMACISTIAFDGVHGKAEIGAQHTWKPFRSLVDKILATLATQVFRHTMVVAVVASQSSLGMACISTECQIEGQIGSCRYLKSFICMALAERGLWLRPCYV